MTRRTEARYTSPLTTTIRPDERGLLNAYATANGLTITEVLRAAVNGYLGTVTDKAGTVEYRPAQALVAPDASLVRREVRAEEKRAAEKLAAKRARQRQTYTPAVPALEG